VIYFIVNEEGGASGFMASMHIDVMITRLVCAFLMHLASEPEIRQSLAMFKFALNQIRNTNSIFDLTDKVFEEFVFID
jgi:hypothetical protein